MRRKRRRIILLVALVALVAGFFLGPKPDYPPLDPVVKASGMGIGELDAYVAGKDKDVDQLRPDNESRLIWANDTLREATPYSIVFLHGFSACPEAGNPVVVEIAKRYGCNLYMPLLADHGRGTKESFIDLTPADLVNSAKEALAIGKLLGKKTIVVGSSTGSTLAIYLAAHNPEYVHAMLNYSPNVELADGSSEMLLWPWGKQIVRMVIGDYRTIQEWSGGPQAAYWTTTYRVEGLLALKHLVSGTMTAETFSKIKQPSFTAYYYKDDENCDKTISIPAAKDFHAQITTPDAQKQIHALPNVGAHAMLNRFQPKDLTALYQKTWSFCEDVLGLRPVE